MQNTPRTYEFHRQVGNIILRIYSNSEGKYYLSANQLLTNLGVTLTDRKVKTIVKSNLSALFEAKVNCDTVILLELPFALALIQKVGNIACLKFIKAFEPHKKEFF